MLAAAAESTAETTSPNRPAPSSPLRRSGLPPGHYSPPMTGTRLGSHIFAGISRPHNYLAQRQSTRVPHPQPELHRSTSVTPPLHLRCTSVAPPLHLRCTSVAPPLHLRYTSVAPPLHLRSTSVSLTEVLRRYYGGATEVLRRCNGGATEVLRRCNGGVTEVLRWYYGGGRQFGKPDSAKRNATTSCSLTMLLMVPQLTAWILRELTAV